jgi:IPT/TIG domain-containing protein
MTLLCIVSSMGYGAAACGSGTPATAGGHTVQHGSPAKPPELLEIAPASAPAGEAYPVTLTIRGTGFMASGNVVEIGPVKIPDVPSTGPDRIAVMLPKSLRSMGGAPPLVLPAGEYPVTVTTAAGTSNAVTFRLTRGP